MCELCPISVKQIPSPRSGATSKLITEKPTSATAEYMATCWKRTRSYGRNWVMGPIRRRVDRHRHHPGSAIARAIAASMSFIWGICRQRPSNLAHCATRARGPRSGQWRPAERRNPQELYFPCRRAFTTKAMWRFPRHLLLSIAEDQFCPEQDRPGVAADGVLRISVGAQRSRDDDKEPFIALGLTVARRALRRRCPAKFSPTISQPLPSSFSTR